jgi:hypothetical protein
VLPVSTVVNPVGDQPPGVYWRRRLLVLAVVLAVLFLVARACGAFASPADPDPAPNADAVPTSTAMTASSPAPSATQPPTATSRPTSAPTATDQCPDDVVRVTASVSDEQYPVGGPVEIRFVVRTNQDATCLRDVGAAANTVTITSEGRRVWSSDDCTPGGNPDVRPIARDRPFAVTVTWQGDVSRPGCTSPRPKAPAGTYEVRGRNGGVTGGPDSFTLG